MLLWNSGTQEMEKDMNNMSLQDAAIGLAQQYLRGRRKCTTGMVNHLYVVWFSKTLQNWKCLISGAYINEYLEITFDGDKGVAYIDCYIKDDTVALTGD